MNRWLRVAAIFGVLGTLVTATGLLGGARAAWFAWLTAFTFWLSLALGALLFIMIQHAMGGTWFLIYRRLAEALTIPLLLLVVLFIPLLFGAPQLYPWASDQLRPTLASEQRTWFTLPFFLIRAAGYFASWVIAAVLLSRWSIQQQHGAAPELARKQLVTSAALLPLIGFTGSFAAFDWLMSLEAGWYSTIFGVYFLSGAILAVLGLLSVITYLLGRHGNLPELTESHTHGLGKMMLVFVIFWAYIAYSQYFLIWIADVPAESHWYLVRSRGGWAWVSLLLVAGNFLVPFVLLLSRTLKRTGRALAAVGALLVAMHYIDVYWLILPAFRSAGPLPTFYDPVAFIGIGGLYAATALWWLRDKPLLPAGDPRLQRALEFFTS